MSQIHIKQKHTLPIGEARKRVEAIARDLQREYKINYAWKGERLLFKRQGVTGYLELGEGFIELKIKLGLALSPMRGKIEKTIKRDMAAELTAPGGTRMA